MKQSYRKILKFQNTRDRHVYRSNVNDDFRTAITIHETYRECIVMLNEKKFDGEKVKREWLSVTLRKIFHHHY